MLNVAKIAIETNTSIKVKPLPFEDKLCWRGIGLFAKLLLLDERL
jgi:hypothetical protein